MPTPAQRQPNTGGGVRTSPCTQEGVAQDHGEGGAEYELELAGSFTGDDLLTTSRSAGTQNRWNVKSIQAAARRPSAQTMADKFCAL